MALQASIGKLSLADDLIIAADVDGDQKITVTDALLILQNRLAWFELFLLSKTDRYNNSRKYESGNLLSKIAVFLPCEKTATSSSKEYKSLNRTFCVSRLSIVTARRSGTIALSELPADEVLLNNVINALRCKATFSFISSLIFFSGNVNLR